MSHEIPPTEVPMLCDVLRRLNDKGTLTIKQIEHHLILGKGSGYNYTSGTDMPFSKFVALFRACRSIEAQQELLNSITDDSGWIHEYIEAAADVDGNGVVNTDDVFKSAIEALGDGKELFSDVLEAQQAEGTAVRRLATHRADQMIAEINRSIEHLLAARKAVAFLARTPRPQPRPITHGSRWRQEPEQPR